MQTERILAMLVYRTLIGIVLIFLAGCSGNMRDTSLLGGKTTKDLPAYRVLISNYHIAELCEEYDNPKPNHTFNSTPAYRDGMKIEISKELESRGEDPLLCRKTSTASTRSNRANPIAEHYKKQKERRAREEEYESRRRSECSAQGRTYMGSFGCQ